MSIKVRAKVDLLYNWTQDVERYKRDTFPECRVRAGDILEVELDTGNKDKYRYRSAGGHVNIIDIDKTEVVVEEKTSVFSTYSVGDKVQVTKDWSGGYTTDQEKINAGFKWGIKRGEILTVLKVMDSAILYETGIKGTEHVINFDLIEPYHGDTPVTTKKPTTQIKGGNWVRALKVSDAQRTTSWWRDLVFCDPQDRMRVGEIFRVREFYADTGYIGYNTGAHGHSRSIPAEWVEVVPDYDPKAVPKRVLFACLTATPILGVLKMNHLMTALSTDPIVHKSIAGLIVTTCVMGGGAMAWRGVKGVGNGFAQWGDRRRRLQQEANQTQAEMIAAAIQASASKKV